MTREEALQILDTIPTIGEQVDALEMAISALEQEPLENIRAEIASHIGGCGFLNDGLDLALEIIDKYCPSCGAKMESEDKE